MSENFKRGFLERCAFHGVTEKTALELWNRMPENFSEKSAEMRKEALGPLAALWLLPALYFGGQSLLSAGKDIGRASTSFGAGRYGEAGKALGSVAGNLGMGALGFIPGFGHATRAGVYGLRSLGYGARGLATAAGMSGRASAAANVASAAQRAGRAGSEAVAALKAAPVAGRVPGTVLPEVQEAARASIQHARTVANPGFYSQKFIPKVQDYMGRTSDWTGRTAGRLQNWAARDPGLNPNLTMSRKATMPGWWARRAVGTVPFAVPLASGFVGESPPPEYSYRSLPRGVSYY